MSDEQTKPAGIMHKRGAMFLHQHIGTASGANGDYYLSKGMSGGMMVESKTTGKVFELDWNTALRLAVEAGVDET